MQLLDGLGEHVRGGVADDAAAGLGVGGHRLDLDLGLRHPREVAQGTVGVTDDDDRLRTVARQARLPDGGARGGSGRHPDGSGRGTGDGGGHGSLQVGWCGSVERDLDTSMLEARTDRSGAHRRASGKTAGEPGVGAGVVPLSVLDLVPIGAGSSAGAALATSTDLVRLAETLGYRRYWVAEHHGMPGIGSSSPAVLVAHLAAVTERIRVGSGGVMLPNHQPLVVAEQFGTLDALHPGRIDLGIGRAPGTDPRTARALRRGTDPLSADDFPEQLAELMAYFRGDGPVTAIPAQGQDPQVWLLGSSGFSAQVAGLLGLPFAFAHHFSGENTLPALELYRRMFRPSEVLDRPVLDDRGVGAGRPGPTRRRGGWRCRPRCSSSSCVSAAPARFPRRRMPPRTRTRRRSAASSTTGWTDRSSAQPRRSGPASRSSWSGREWMS